MNLLSLFYYTLGLCWAKGLGCKTRSSIILPTRSTHTEHRAG